MSFINSIKDNKSRVAYLLENYPHLRDDDNKLMSNIWYNELKALKIAKTDFLKALAEGRLTSPKTIFRTRRIIQKENPNLQGKLKDKRKDLELETRKKIHEL